MSITHSQIENTLKSLPSNPGVYQFFDASGKIIYIGKAKNLKKRVTSYFNKATHESGKVAVMVKKIAGLEFIVVETEFDALLLENNLIKQYQPRYNILLKDDKTYPFICIKNERFPRVFPTRIVVKDGSLYFGPYASVRMMNTLLELIRQIFPLRNCSLNLSEDNISRGKFKTCLEYQIGNCKGPCERLQTMEEYDATINQIKSIIKGNFVQVLRQLKVKMHDLSIALEFEKAQLLKEKINILENFRSKSAVVNPAITNVDVFSIHSNTQEAYVNFLKIIDGAIIQSHSIEIKKKLDESDQELLALTIAEFRERYGDDAAEIIVPVEPDTLIPEVRYSIPQKGDKKELLNLSERNAKYFLLEKQKQKSLADPERHSKRVLEKAMTDLRMKVIPMHIECFDNSNTQGTDAVAAMVVFRNAKPDKSEYRHFIIRTVEGPDDFASMEEVIYRRYKRLIEEKKDLPQLIIIDGGKGQLSSAVKSLEKLSLRGKIAIIGIAKKLEEIYTPGDTLPLHLDKKSETLKLIQRMRDEAHRFGITHHRNRREKKLLSSELLKIEGIGEKTIQQLLRKYKSVANLRQLSHEDIAEIAGNAKAKLILEYLQKTGD